MGTFANIQLQCCDCKQQFEFDAAEQRFFAAVGLVNQPKRCHKCRLVAKMRRSGKAATECCETICAECGKVTLVPFKPKGHSPVYCHLCHKKLGYGSQKVAGMDEASSVIN